MHCGCSYPMIIAQSLPVFNIRTILFVCEISQISDRSIFDQVRTTLMRKISLFIIATSIKQHRPIQLSQEDYHALSIHTTKITIIRPGNKDDQCWRNQKENSRHCQTITSRTYCKDDGLSQKVRRWSKNKSISWLSNSVYGNWLWPTQKPQVLEEMQKFKLQQKIIGGSAGKGCLNVYSIKDLQTVKQSWHSDPWF